MKMKIRAWLGLFTNLAMVLGCLHALPARADNSVVMTTTEFAPYMGSSLRHQGVLVAIADEAFRREGYSLKVRFLPWARALAYAKEGRADGMVGIWHSQEREQWFLYPKSVLSNQIGFYARVGRPLTYKNLVDLKPYVIGTVRAYANPPAFDAAHLHTEEAVDDLTNLRKLAAGRLDLVLVDRAVAQYLIDNALPELKSQLQWVSPPIDILPLYVAVSRQAPEAGPKLAALNAGLESMQKDGSLARLVTALQ